MQVFYFPRSWFLSNLAVDPLNRVSNYKWGAYWPVLVKKSLMYIFSIPNEAVLEFHCWLVECLTHGIFLSPSYWRSAVNFTFPTSYCPHLFHPPVASYLNVSNWWTCLSILAETLSAHRTVIPTSMFHLHQREQVCLGLLSIIRMNTSGGQLMEAARPLSTSILFSPFAPFITEGTFQVKQGQSPPYFPFKQNMGSALRAKRTILFLSMQQHLDYLDSFKDTYWLSSHNKLG